MNRIERFLDFFSNLTEVRLEQIDEVFAPNVHFKDPFNDVVGSEQVKKIFRHMFATTTKPSFLIAKVATSDDTLFLQWDFTFQKNSKDWLIQGCSVVTFDDNDQVKEHIDFWDPAEQIYSKISFLKPLMSFLANRLKAG